MITMIMLVLSEIFKSNNLDENILLNWGIIPFQRGKTVRKGGRI